jgi:hypothetical protein
MVSVVYTVLVLCYVSELSELINNIKISKAGIFWLAAIIRDKKSLSGTVLYTIR